MNAAIKTLAKIPKLKYQVTPMATVLEASDLSSILRAVEVSHRALRSIGAKRISSILRVDERFDKPRTMKDKVQSLNL